MNISKKLIVTLSALVLASAPVAHAAVINVAQNTATPPAALDRTLISAGSGGTETGVTLQVGESAVDTGAFRAYVPFTLTAADKADLLVLGATATLNLRAVTLQNAAGSAINVLGLTDRGADVAGNPNDYAAAVTPAAALRWSNCLSSSASLRC